MSYTRSSMLCSQKLHSRTSTRQWQLLSIRAWARNRKAEGIVMQIHRQAVSCESSQIQAGCVILTNAVHQLRGRRVLRERNPSGMIGKLCADAILLNGSCDTTMHNSSKQLCYERARAQPCSLLGHHAKGQMSTVCTTNYKLSTASDENIADMPW